MLAIEEYDEITLNTIRSKGNRKELERHLAFLAREASLAKLWDIGPQWRQAVIDRIVGNGKHVPEDRDFSLVLTKEGAKRLKSIGAKGVTPQYMGKEIKLVPEKPRELTAKRAISLYLEFGPHAEDVAKRGTIVEAELTE